MKSSHILKVPAFSKQAKALRREYDNRFHDPKQAQAGRFVWDYWHVPDQYTLLRTPAYEYFERELYMRFHTELVMWGRRQLGCWDISPPWMSCYVEGCKQELHSDVPHGPWAFVFSLSPQTKKFSGGETLILKPETLNYWKSFSVMQDREHTSFVDREKSRFNELIVFDPRYPHGVTEVRGTHDPREGRLVIHGWFTEPKTYIDGFLPAAHVEKKLNEAFQDVAELLQVAEPCQGVMSLQISVGKSGTVNGLRWGTANLKTENGETPRSILRTIERIYSSLEFKSAKGTTHMTVPLIVG